MSHKYSECDKIHPNVDCFDCRYRDRDVEDAPCRSCIFGKECEFESTDIMCPNCGHDHEICPKVL